MFFKGDAPLWIEYARALRAGRPFELGLPIHPPGTPYLVAALWDGTVDTFPLLRLVFCDLGAACVVLVAIAAARAFGPVVALVAGLYCCMSTGLLVLSGSVDSEMPYLVLVLTALALHDDVRTDPRPRTLVAWAAASGLACLFRVEHVLFVALMSALLVAGWWKRASLAAAARHAAIAALAFVVPLVPWHVHAWGAIARFNEVPPPEPPVPPAAALPWTAEAARARDALPAFCRRANADFVAATVAWRGGREVASDELRILDDAFGYRPQPLRRFPFVSSYGPLNFALANAPGARGGFDRGALDAPPPLIGGRDRYPPALIAGLPPPEGSFTYPPHVHLFNDGYAIGARWIREQPARFARLVAIRSAIFVEGLTLGWTGFGAPVGLEGTRRNVDLATGPATGAVSLVWRGGLLAVALAGLLAGWRRPALVPWLVLLASKWIAAVAFFGYARHGASMIPVLAVLVGLAVERVTGPDVPEKTLTRVALCVLLAGTAVEAVRWARPPVILTDGMAIGPIDPVPPALYRDTAITIAR